MDASFGAASGTVVAFDEDRGTGTVRADDGVEYFFHCTQMADGSRTIELGIAVGFEVRPGHGGRWEAAHLEKHQGSASG